jgi:hypothetical protein
VSGAAYWQHGTAGIIWVTGITVVVAHGSQHGWQH